MHFNELVGQSMVGMLEPCKFNWWNEHMYFGEKLFKIFDPQKSGLFMVS